MKKAIFLIIFLVCSISSQQGWVPQNTNVTNQINDIFFINQNTGFAACNNSILLKTTNSGVNWISYQVNYGDLYKVKFFDNNTGFIGATNKILKSTNGGINWFVSKDSIGGNSIGGTEGWIVNPNFAVFSKGNYIINSINLGATWNSIYVSNGPFQIRSLFFMNTNTGWMTTYQEIFTPQPRSSISLFKSTNSGLTWSGLWGTSFLGSNSCNMGDVFFVNHLTGYFVFNLPNNNNYIAKSENGGSTISVKAVPNIQNSLFFSTDNNGWTIGTNGSIYHTSNSGANWDLQNSSINTNLLSVYFVDSLTGWACGNNGIILRTTNSGITAINNINDEIPNKFEVYQNYPNPFNPVTNIKFDIPKSSNVKILIYDILGKEIAVLVNQKINAGSYSVDWNASAYPSGVYFYKLVTDDFVESKKMVLVK